MIRLDDFETAIVRLLDGREAEASICPSEVARDIAGADGSWRSLMEPARAAAARMALRGIVRVTQGKEDVDLSLSVKGPVRIRRGAAWSPERSDRAKAPATESATQAYPTTPDGRYFVVRGRLWRKTNPALPEPVREALVKQLMDARRLLRGRRPEAERSAARAQVEQAKRALGERGPVWWHDGAPDFNRRMARNTPYRAWFLASPPSPQRPA